MFNKSLLYLKWIAGGNCPVTRGNPISSSTSFDRDNKNGLTMKEIILSQGKVALVDDEDYEYLNQWKWCAVKARKTYYANRSVLLSGEKKTIFMHRLIMNTPAGLETDHADGNGLNNIRSNLRIATRQQNTFNRRASISKSKYTGVYVWYKHGRRYIKAMIHQDGRNVSLGNYPTEEEAALAYNEAALKYRGEYARLNLIESR